MGTFTWLGGDIGNGNNWSSGGSTGTEPGPNDDAVLANGGHVLGLASVGQAEFTGAFVLSGANLQAGGEALSSGGSITQKDGINAIAMRFDATAIRTAIETWLIPENFDAAGLQRRSLSEMTAAATARTNDIQPVTGGLQ